MSRGAAYSKSRSDARIVCGGGGRRTALYLLCLTLPVSAPPRSGSYEPIGPPGGGSRRPFLNLNQVSVIPNSPRARGPERLVPVKGRTIKRERSSRESVRPALARSYRNRFGLHHLLGPLPAPPRGLSRAAVQGSMAQRPSSIHKAIHTRCRHPTVHTFTRTSYSHSPFRERTGHDIYLRGARGSPLRTLTPSSRSSPAATTSSHASRYHTDMPSW